MPYGIKAGAVRASVVLGENGISERLSQSGAAVRSGVPTNVADGGGRHLLCRISSAGAVLIVSTSDIHV